MGAGLKVYTNVSFSSRNIWSFMGSKTLQIHCYYRISHEQHSSTLTFQTLIWNELVGYRWRENGTLGEVLSLATPRGAVMGKIWLLWVFRSLENAFAAIVDLKMLSDTDGYTKPLPQSLCNFMQISLYIILLTGNFIPSKIAFPWSHLPLELSQISYYNCCDSTFKKMSLSIQQDTPWRIKLMLNSNLT